MHSGFSKVAKKLSFRWMRVLRSLLESKELDAITQSPRHRHTYSPVIAKTSPIIRAIWTFVIDNVVLFLLAAVEIALWYSKLPDQ